MIGKHYVGLIFLKAKQPVRFAGKSGSAKLVLEVLKNFVYNPVTLIDYF